MREIDTVPVVDSPKWAIRAGWPSGCTFVGVRGRVSRRWPPRRRRTDCIRAPSRSASSPRTELPSPASA